MRLLTGRNHPHFNLDGGSPQGIKTVVRAAKDPVAREPEDESVAALLRTTLCRAKLDFDTQKWKVTSVIGTEVQLPYGATLEAWTTTCKQLLQEAMESPR